MTLQPGTALVTGSAGFIGAAIAQRLLAEGWTVIGLDALDPYYDVALKEARQARLAGPRFTPVTGRIEEEGLLERLFADHRPSLVVHLAAQAGVRHSIKAPRTYVRSNLVGTFELLEAARAHPPAHMVLASTSSVYGASEDMPYAEGQKADHQMSFYAATKKGTENMAHAYAHLYGLPMTMFRFFTVYGPWGRPDMAPYLFTRAILDGDPIEVFNRGRMRRDFTFIDDLVESVRRLADAVPETGRPASDADTLSPVAPFRVVNVGGSAPVELGRFIAAVEAATGRTAKQVLRPMQPGDVPATWADVTLLRDLTGDVPATPVEEGVRRYVEWFRSYYGR